jgi:GNAT superfamily N-acetyltransferase
MHLNKQRKLYLKFYLYKSKAIIFSYTEKEKPMEATDVVMKEMTVRDAAQILPFVQKLNPGKPEMELARCIEEMFRFENYYCLGLFQNEQLLGLMSGWMTVRFYCGRQLEIDNVIVDTEIRSAGLGKQFLNLVEAWAKERHCQTIELNTYVQNSRSHKFYFNAGYKILGYHFQKEI